MELIDRSFDLSHTINYTLSIRTVPDGFCFIVFDKKKHKVLYFLEVTEKGRIPYQFLSALKDKYPALQMEYEDVLWIYDTSSYTLLPAFLYNPDDIRKYWNLAFDKTETTSVLTADNLGWADVVTIYELPDELQVKSREQFPAVRFMSQQSVHILTSMLENKKNNVTQVYIQVFPDFFDAVVLEKGKLMLANSYQYRSTDEFLYFILNIFEQFNLDQYTTETILSGDIAAHDEKNMLLKKYIKEIRFKEVFADISGLKFDKKDPAKQYSNLLNLPLCAL
jgi:hypothetical protein